MEVETIKDDLTEVKPKKKRAKAVSTGKEQVTKTVAKTKPAKAKAKKPASMKKPSTVTKRKKVEDDILMVSQGPESQPMGQAEISNLKVELAAVKPGSSFSGNKMIETTQIKPLPFFAVRAKNINGEVAKLTAEIIPGRVIVQGIIHDQAFLIGNDGVIHHLADEDSFSAILDIPGVQRGMKPQVSAVIEDILHELAPDGLSLTKRYLIAIKVEVIEAAQLALTPGDGPQLLLNRVVGQVTAQSMVESTLTLATPGLRIDEVTGSVRDLKVQAITDRVLIRGTLHKQVFFVDNAGTGRYQAADIPFSLVKDIPGVAPGMTVQAVPTIEGLYYNLASGTTLRQRAVLGFSIKVTDQVLQSVVEGAGPLLKVAQYVGENTVHELNESIITLNTPTIRVREISADIRNLNTRVVANRVIIQGTIHNQLFLIGDDEREHHQIAELPLTLMLDLPGSKPDDAVKLNSKIEGVFFELTAERSLKLRVITGLTAIVARETQLNLVTGGKTLFSVDRIVGVNNQRILRTRLAKIAPAAPVVPERPAVTTKGADQVIASGQLILKKNFALPEQAVGLKTIMPAVVNVSSKAVPDGVVTSGVVKETISYIGMDNIVRNVTEEVPFSILAPVAGITQAQIGATKVKVEEISRSLAATGGAVDHIIMLKAEVCSAAFEGFTA